jgi:hypothetical protein
MTGIDSVREWLLEPENPSARYLALTQLFGHAGQDPDVTAAQRAISHRGPARAILDAQWPGGYWMAPGVGHSPRHRATVWQVIFLGDLGAPLTGEIAQACAYVLEHSRLPDGRFSAQATARGATVCLNGNLLRAMARLGYRDARLDESLAALAEMVRRDRFCCRFNAERPLPARMAEGLPCAWGAVKALGAFAAVPEAARSPGVRAAMAAAVAFLAGEEATPAGVPPLVRGAYPTATSPSPLWQRFAFPLGETSDLVEALDVLGQAGVGRFAGLGQALSAVRDKRRHDGTWALDRTLENTWADFGAVGTPNKWVTIRALVALRRWEIME